jgi:hypothetical protein
MSNVKSNDGTFLIKKDFTFEYLENIGDEFIYQINQVTDLIKFTTFSDSVSNLNNTRTVDRFYRISLDECNKSDWLELPLFENLDALPDGFKNAIFPLYNVTEEEFKNMFDYFPSVSSAVDYIIEIKWVRTGTNTENKLIINSFELSGLWDRNVSTIAILDVNAYNVPLFIRPEDTYKVFSLTDFEIVSNGVTVNKTLDVQYRISQDNWRNSTPWEDLTTANISTAMEKHRLSPIRFFNIEYKLLRAGTDSTTTIKVTDINLVGDFQNVSEDYTKTNLMGIRECCSDGNTTHLAIYEGNGIPGFKNDSSLPAIKDETDDCLPPVFNGMSDAEKNGLWKPYEVNKAVDLFSSLATSTVEMFGWEVQYFLTDPDRMGTDHTFHEHQLKNVVDENKMKLSVDQNQFPDNQITFNQFELSLFESFEVHITKEMFKRTFGVDQRPSKEDFMWFCDINKMYSVEHAQPHRDFMNAAVYYKVILKKYNQKASVQPVNQTIATRIEELTKNSTLDELFGMEISNDKIEVANKDQHVTLSKDLTRHSYSAKIIKELIPNGSLIINKYHYDLSVLDGVTDLTNPDFTLLPLTKAVTYSKVDSYVRESDNRAFSFWFKMSSYVVNEVYSFMHNFSNDLGYKVEIFGGNLTTTFNTNSYSMPVDLIDDVWYCIEINLDQRQRKIEHYLYKRNITDETLGMRLKVSDLKLETSQTQDLTIDKFEFDSDNEIVIYGSTMKLTNIRIYNDVVAQSSHNKVLNQNILRDTDYLILADNSNNKYYMENYKYN